MSMLSDAHNKSLEEKYEKNLDELEKAREHDCYINGTEYQKGLIDGAIIQIIKLKEEIIWL